MRIKSVTLSIEEPEINSPDRLSFPVDVELLGSPNFFKEVLIKLKLMADTILRHFSLKVSDISPID